jgi:hypothetical protein
VLSIICNTICLQFYLYRAPLQSFGLFLSVITKLPNSEQSYKGKVQTHNYINSQQPENCENRKTTLYVIVDKIFQTPVLGRFALSFVNLRV